jgi:TatD DNase family protein
MDLFDAHNHFQEERLDGWREELMGVLPGMGVREMMVNGMSEGDWGKVAALAERVEWVRPSFGLHPWWVKGRSEAWREVLEGWVRAFPGAGVGEAGLDRWIEDPDVEAQVECFKWQVALAVREGRALSVHCVRAFGLLDEVLREVQRPERGFLIHSYGGPEEMVAGFARMGAYFSVSPHFALERKRGQLEVFGRVPLDRLLIETDAPDLWPPPEVNPNRLQLADGREVNSPANLRFSYELVAGLRGMPVEDLAAVVGENYRRLFGGPLEGALLPVKTVA